MSKKTYNNRNIPARYNPPWGTKTNYHSPRGTETVVLLLHFIKLGKVTNCLELLEQVGYTEERALLMLAAVQVAGGAS